MDNTNFQNYHYHNNNNIIIIFETYGANRPLHNKHGNAIHRKRSFMEKSYKQFSSKSLNFGS